jgi:type I restriction-modification system DNA methylase subunit
MPLGEYEARNLILHRQNVREFDLGNQEQDMPRNLGAVYTPPEFARLQIDWVIRNPQDTLLDIGVGEGEFTLTAHQRLVELGVDSDTAQNQIYGAEIYRPAYDRFTELAARAGLRFPNVYPLDFFEADFPGVDGVTGNLPFVRRSLIDDVEVIRQRVFDDSQGLDETEISRLSDLYIYCLLRGASFLKEGGRLAVITSDSWLNAKYGIALKNYLQKNFKVDGLVSFDRQIFDAEVKSVLMFATKKVPTRGPRNIHFIRVKNGLPAGDVLQVLDRPRTSKPDVEVVTVKARDLDAHSHWAAHFKSSDLCEEIASHSLMTPMSEVGQTSLGIQTLAKYFLYSRLKGHVYGRSKKSTWSRLHSRLEISRPQ